MLTPCQSGFRPGDSAISQLLLITHKIYVAFHEIPSRETRAVFLDLSKAFDKVWHDELLYKLEICGISGNLLDHLRIFFDKPETVHYSMAKAQIGRGILLASLGAQF